MKKESKRLLTILTALAIVIGGVFVANVSDVGASSQSDPPKVIANILYPDGSKRPWFEKDGNEEAIAAHVDHWIRLEVQDGDKIKTTFTTDKNGEISVKPGTEKIQVHEMEIDAPTMVITDANGTYVSRSVREYNGFGSIWGSTQRVYDWYSDPNLQNDKNKVKCSEKKAPTGFKLADDKYVSETVFRQIDTDTPDVYEWETVTEIDIIDEKKEEPTTKNEEDAVSPESEDSEEDVKDEGEDKETTTREKTNTSANTGDESNAAPVMALFGISLLGIAVILIRHRRKIRGAARGTLVILLVAAVSAGGYLAYGTHTHAALPSEEAGGVVPGPTPEILLVKKDKDGKRLPNAEFEIYVKPIKEQQCPPKCK